MSANDTLTEDSPLIPKTPNVKETGPAGLSFALLLGGVWSLVFVSSVDGSIVATLLGPISSSFDAMQLSSWLGTSYLLSVCCCSPLYGRLCNIIGRRPSILLAGVLFGVGTICCGLARSMNQLIAFRALAGMGGGGMSLVGSVVVSDVVPLKSRGLYQGFANLLFALGGTLGAPLGGWLGDTIGWRAAFLTQSPLLLTALVILYLHVQEPASLMASTASSMSISDKLKRVDYAGSATLTATLTTLLIGLSIKNTGHCVWTDGTVFLPLLASVVLGVLFFAIELKWATEPMVPVALLKRRTPAFVALCNFLVSGLSISIIYNVPLYFSAARLRTSANAGAHLISNSTSVAVGSLLVGWYMRRTGRYWNFQMVAAMGIVATTVRLATWSDRTPEWIMYITLFPSGFGFSTILITSLLALMASAPRDEIPVVTGISYLFRTAGQVLGVALSSTLTQSVLATNLRARIEGDGAFEIIAKIRDSTSYIHNLPPHLQEQATISWEIALRTLFSVQVIVAFCLFLSVLPIEEYVLPDTVANTTIERPRSQN